MGSGSLLPHRLLQPACSRWSVRVFVVIQYLLVSVVASPPVGSVVVAVASEQRHGASHLRPLLHPGARRTPPTVRHVTENARLGLAKGAMHPGYGPAGETNRPAQDAMRPGLGVVTGKAGWGVDERRSSARASFSGNADPGVAMRRKGRGTQCSNGLRRQRPVRWEPRCNGKRPVRSRWQADRSMSKLRCRYHCSAAAPQA